MEQTIEGTDLSLNLKIAGELASIKVDKVVYSPSKLEFIQSEKVILSVNLKKEFKTIYDALKYLGINAEGY